MVHGSTKKPFPILFCLFTSNCCNRRPTLSSFSVYIADIAFKIWLPASFGCQNDVQQNKKYWVSKFEQKDKAPLTTIQINKICLHLVGEARPLKWNRDYLKHIIKQILINIASNNYGSRSSRRSIDRHSSCHFQQESLCRGHLVKWTRRFVKNQELTCKQASYENLHPDLCIFIEVAIVVYFVHSLLLLKYIKSSIRKLTHSMNLGRALPDYPPFYKRYIVPMQVHFVYFQSVLPWFDDFVSLKCNYVWLFCHLHLPTCPQVITFVSSYWYALLLKSCENR